MVVLIGACGGGSGTNRGATTPHRVEPLVSTVAVRGNRVLAAVDILEGLSTRGPSGRILTTNYRYDPIQAELDRKRIESYYQGRGFFSARVTEVELRRFDDPMSGPLVDVVFVVREGPRTAIATVDTAGAPEELRAAIDEVIAGAEVRPREPIVYWRYSVAKTRVKALLVRNGYAFARVRGQVEVDRRRARAAVKIEIDPGPLARFGRLTDRKSVV